MSSDWKFSADTVLDESGTPEVDSHLSESLSGGGKEPLSDREALDNTEVLMNLRETVQSFGLSMYVHGNLKEASRYDYEQDEKQRLIRAWSRVIGHYQVRVSPWVDVLVTEAVCTGPLVALAIQARKSRLEVERLRAENNDLRSQAGAAASESERPDVKMYWKIDKDGFFERNPEGAYIPKEHRRQKPKMNEDTYQMLVKHNGQEIVDKIFQ